MFAFSSSSIRFSVRWYLSYKPFNSFSSCPDSLIIWRECRNIIAFSGDALRRWWVKLFTIVFSLFWGISLTFSVDSTFFLIFALFEWLIVGYFLDWMWHSSRQLFEWVCVRYSAVLSNSPDVCTLCDLCCWYIVGNAPNSFQQ